MYKITHFTQRKLTNIYSTSYSKKYVFTCTIKEAKTGWTDGVQDKHNA